MLEGLPVMQIVVGGGWPESDNQGYLSSSQPAIRAGRVFASTLMRWIVLPRVKNPQTLLTTIVIGLALAEATWFWGMFMISSDFPTPNAPPSSCPSSACASLSRPTPPAFPATPIIFSLFVGGVTRRRRLFHQIKPIQF